MAQAKVNLVRYADDFIITGATQANCWKMKSDPWWSSFLRERGLTLSAEKTSLTHIAEGFDFLGRNVRKYGGKLLIKPSKKNQHAFLEKVREIIRRNKAVEQKFLIKMLNPVIRGWTNYHRHITATQAFRKVEMVIWQRLWRWAKRRHQDRSPTGLKPSDTGTRLGRKRRTFAADSGERTPDGKPRKLCELVDPRDPHIGIREGQNPEANPFDSYMRTLLRKPIRLENEEKLTRKVQMAETLGTTRQGMP